ncbi:MAG: phosphorybosylanthranilate isomerase [Deltaproteobacteria bacterium]|nr:MAG: phosphorybosylanthranilate isomerase [Deltaproteobacteria bacterium]
MRATEPRSNATACPRGLIGVVHLPPLPGDPCSNLAMGQVLERAARDAEALAEGGAAAVLVENFGSAPFSKGDLSEPTPQVTLAAMSLAAARCAEVSGLPLGVNVLRNDAAAALAIAAATGAAFIRVNVHCGAMLTDQGLIEGRAHHTLRLRRSLGIPHVAILADVRVKHAAPLSPRPLAEEVRETVERGRADAIILTGASTGGRIATDDLLEAAAATRAPLVLGSGVGLDNVDDLAPHAHAAIVGTSLKRDGALHNPIDPDRVRALVQRLRAALPPIGLEGSGR